MMVELIFIQLKKDKELAFSKMIPKDTEMFINLNQFMDIIIIELLINLI